MKAKCILGVMVIVDHAASNTKNIKNIIYKKLEISAIETKNAKKQE